MNINDFLPLLMKNSSANPQMATLLSAFAGGGLGGFGAGAGSGVGAGGGLGSGDNSKIMETLLSQMGGGGGKNAELLTLLKLMQEGQKKSNKPMGFAPIFPFVPKDILGIMVKYFAK